MGRKRWGIVAAIALAAALLGSLSWSLPGLSNFERAVFDAYRFVLAEKIERDPRIALVIYDETVMRETGKTSPLDRQILADALRNIDAIGVKSIGIDMIFIQPTDDEEPLLAALRGLRAPTSVNFADPEFDRASFWPDEVAEQSEQYQHGFWARLKGSRVKPASSVVGVDTDGIARRWPNLAPGQRLPLSASMTGARQFDGYGGSIRFTRYDQPRDLETLNPATGMFRPIQIDTLADPDEAEVIADEIRGRHVLIGADSFNIDQLSTSITRIGNLPPVAGVYTHAHMLRQALEGQRFTPFLFVFGVLLCGLAALAGALSGAMDRRLTLVIAAAIVQVAAIAALPAALHAMNYDIWSVPVVGMALAWLASCVAALSVSRRAGTEARLFAHDALGKYLPEPVARQIIANPRALNLSGERRQLFIMFTDLQGFTKFSHALSPEDTAAILNEYLALMSEIVLARCGTIDKFVGDAIVAFWGAPIAGEADAANALTCALEIDAASSRFAEEQAARGFQIGVTRIGLHHGEAVVGNFGAAKRIQYTAIGDAMNVAARLESANKQLGTRILVSASAARACGFENFRALGAIGLSGVSTPIEVYEPLSSETSKYSAAFAAAAAAALQPDRRKLAPLRDLQSAHPGDRVLRLMLARLTQGKAGAVYELRSK